MALPNRIIIQPTDYNVHISPIAGEINQMAGNILLSMICRLTIHKDNPVIWLIIELLEARLWYFITKVQTNPTVWVFATDDEKYQKVMNLRRYLREARNANNTGVIHRDAGMQGYITSTAAEIVAEIDRQMPDPAPTAQQVPVEDDTALDADVFLGDDFFLDEELTDTMDCLP